MNRTALFALFLLVVLAQLAVPASMIIKHEHVIQNGKEIKIHTRPVDPYDAFRGRYVQIGFDETTAPMPLGSDGGWRQKAYAVVDTDADGFVVVKSVSFTVPQEHNYLKVVISPYTTSKKEGQCQIYWNLDRYYMSEAAAPQAEAAYRNRTRTSTAYIKVRVANGIGVITGLYIDDKPIEQCIKTP